MTIGARLRVALFKLNGTRRFCNDAPKSTNNGNQSSGSNKIESNISKYDETYRKLDELDFMTSAKILFNEPPKTRKFGIDFHLVQFFFACLPSLAVYLVAQYARHEMRKMDAELERKQEEAKAKEMELKAMEEKEARSDHEILEVKVRLEKLEEAIKEIVVEAKKQSDDDAGKTQEDSHTKKHIEETRSGDTSCASESHKSLEKENLRKQKSTELAPGEVKVTGLTPTLDASLKEENSKKQKRVGTSEDATKE